MILLFGVLFVVAGYYVLANLPPNCWCFDSSISFNRDIGVVMGYGLVLSGILPLVWGSVEALSVRSFVSSRATTLRSKAILIIVLLCLGSIGGVLAYSTQAGPVCTPYGGLGISSAQVVSLHGSLEYYSFLVCDGTGKGVNWVGAYIDGQQFYSSGPRWVHSTLGTFLDGNGTFIDGTDWVDLSTSIPNPTVCSFTFSGWVFDRGIKGQPSEVLGISSNNSADSSDLVQGVVNDSKIYFKLGEIESSTSIIANAGYIAGDFKERWEFLSIVLSDGKTMGYVNGTQSWAGKNVGCLVTGAYSAVAAHNTFLRNVTFYSRTLNPDEIQQLYQGEGVSGGLVGSWPLDDGHGCDVRDLVGHGRTNFVYDCLSIQPGGTYQFDYSYVDSSSSNPYTQPPMSIGLRFVPGNRVNVTVVAQFSDGSYSTTSRSVVVEEGS